MNDISKTSIKARLEKAMETEALKPSETARIFGIHPNYVSMIKNPNTWDKCPASAWEAVLTWVNSGQGLKQWSEKHGKVLTPPIKEKEELKIKVKPEAIEKRIKELAKKQNPLVESLKEEKELLLKKVEAINILLKYYLS